MWAKVGLGREARDEPRHFNHQNNGHGWKQFTIPREIAGGITDIITRLLKNPHIVNTGSGQCPRHDESNAGLGTLTC